MNFVKKIVARLLWVLPSVCLVLVILFTLFEKRQYEEIIQDLGGYEALESGAGLDQSEIFEELTKQGYFLPYWYWSVKPKYVDQSNPPSFLNTRPIVEWNGSDCKWQLYVNRLFRSKWTSAKDGRPVWPKIWRAVSITFLINLIALIIIILIAIPFGKKIYKSKSKGYLSVLFGWSSIPLFWIATMVYIFGLSMFSETFSGIPQLRPQEEVNVFTFLRIENLRFLIMPIISIVLAGTVYLAIQMYRSLRSVDEQRFMMSARSKGISDQEVLEKHSMPNAMITIYTIIGNSLPGLISGSVVIEWIFNIPGMGRLLWNAVIGADWHVILGIFFISLISSVIAQIGTDLYHHSKLKVGY